MVKTVITLQYNILYIHYIQYTHVETYNRWKSEQFKHHDFILKQRFLSKIQINSEDFGLISW